MRKLIKVTEAGTGFIADYIGDNGEKCRDYIIETLGSIVPPESQSPGYFLFIGLMFDQVPAGPQKLLFLSEGENRVRATLTFGMNDDAIRLHASTIYADKANKGFFAALWGMAKRYYLKPAASVENADYGDALITETVISKAINWPHDSIVYQQVMDIDHGEDLKKPELYAFHALRFILAGIERDIQITGKTRQQHYDLESKRYHKPSHGSNTVGQSGAGGAVL